MENTDLNFEFATDHKTLLAIYDIKPDNSLTINQHWISDRLIESGYGELALIDEGVTRLIDAFKGNGEQNGKICIAEKRDAEVTLFISKDKMSAYLTIKPEHGGEKVNLDQVKRALADKGIRNGFIPEAIKSAILKGQANEVLIARGKPVENGEDAKFRCLIPNLKIRTPHIAENGNVDFRDLGEILVVQPQQELMRREPATMGKESKNIFGERVTAHHGKDHKFAKGLEGVEKDPNNPNLLRAAITGQPVIVENGVSVENTMTIQQVNLASGNIIFDGSVIITGDIDTGMKVEATGDINIGGAVEGAHIKAGGDVIVNGAIIGHGDVRDPKGNLNDETAKIYATGSISAKFVENAYLESQDKIMIQDWVVKSELSAVNEIIVGNKNARKGQIIGGRILSGLMVKAMKIGAESGVKTLVIAGKETDIDADLDKLNSEINRQNQALLDLRKLHASLKNNPTKQAQEMLKKSLKTQQHMEDELIDYHARKSILKKEKTRIENSKIIVDSVIYNGSIIKIANHKKEIKDDLGKRSFILKDGQLVQIVEK